MMALESKETQIDDLLDKMAEAIQLDDTRYDRMKTSYESVKNWIEGDELFFKAFSFDVYPHGSVRILTTVKPFGKDEFDLDIVVHLRFGTAHTPQKIYTELKRCMEAYAKKHGLKIKTKNRCIRLIYEGDYHIDILPGIQENAFDKNKINVPDRELKDYVSSNPRGYAVWFLGKANLVKESLLQKALRAEKLPADNFEHKKPLQRAVQLIKRYRDIFFQKDDTYKTSSIILSTIAGQFYQGEESIFDTVDNIVSAILTRVNYSFGRFKVLNPVNPEEDFTDKWEGDSEYYKAFKRFASHLYNEWEKLKTGHSLLDDGAIMKGLFGDDTFKKAILAQASGTETLRNANFLGIEQKTGILTYASAAASTTIRQNTFFGGTAAKKFIKSNKTIAEQFSSMKNKYPQWETRFASYNAIQVTGTIQPTARSNSYQFMLRYHQAGMPEIKIISPALKTNEKGEMPDHLYSGDKLCLYQPKYHEFTKNDLLSESIVPWIALWLYYYENWLLTGEWLGGGEHPKAINA